MDWMEPMGWMEPVWLGARYYFNRDYRLVSHQIVLTVALVLFVALININ